MDRKEKSVWVCQQNVVWRAASAALARPCFSRALSPHFVFVWLFYLSDGSELLILCLGFKLSPV